MADARTVRQALWRQTPYNAFRTDLTQERADELAALLQHSTLFGDICRINYGAQISTPEGAADEAHKGKATRLGPSSDGMENPKKYYDGDAMRPYGMTWPGTYLDYSPNPRVMYGPRKLALFENDKLSIRYVSGDSDTFLAWVDLDHYYTDHLVIHAVPYHAVQGEPSYRVSDEQAERSRQYPLFYLLGVIMSLPALRYYAELYATGSLQGAFSHVYPDTVKALPIPILRSLPQEPPDDWWDRGRDLVSGGRRVSPTAIRRAFKKRSVVASVLAAAAERRQEVEGRRATRADAFIAFMDSRSPGWRWPRGHSLEEPPEENVFLRTVSDDMVSMQAVAAIRSAFHEQTAASQAEVGEAAQLQEIIDALSARLYATSPQSGAI
jgi:hypothetical protein